MVKKLTKYGNSLALVIDRLILELLKIDPETPLEVSTDGRQLIVAPAKPPARVRPLTAFPPATGSWSAIPCAPGKRIVVPPPPLVPLPVHGYFTSAAESAAHGIHPDQCASMVLVETRSRKVIHGLSAAHNGHAGTIFSWLTKRPLDVF